MALLHTNIDRRGRAIRGFVAATLASAAAFAWPESPISGAVLALCAAFVAFEAARGWCVARACGVKTRF